VQLPKIWQARVQERCGVAPGELLWLVGGIHDTCMCIRIRVMLRCNSKQEVALAQRTCICVALQPAGCVQALLQVIIMYVCGQPMVAKACGRLADVVSTRFTRKQLRHPPDDPCSPISSKNTCRITMRCRHAFHGVSTG
jgi:hypothetical protein